MNKKALSQIITSILLVALVISSIIIISSVILNIVKKPLSSPEFSCINLLSKSILELNSACYNPSSKDIEIKVKRKPSDNYIDSLTFNIIKSDNAQSLWTCGNSCGGCIIQDSGETKTYFFSQENPDLQVKVELYSYSCKLDEIEITEC